MSRYPLPVADTKLNTDLNLPEYASNYEYTYFILRTMRDSDFSTIIITRYFELVWYDLLYAC